MRQRALELVCRGIAERTSATRASIWAFSPDAGSITSLCLFDAWHDGFSGDVTLRREDYAPYFEAMLADRKVVAPRARTHPATACFNRTYFEPLDIHSLLDFVVLVDGVVAGIVCCEHCGEPRHWTESDMGVLAGHAELVATLLSA